MTKGMHANVLIVVFTQYTVYFHSNFEVKANKHTTQHDLKVLFHLTCTILFYLVSN